MPEDRLLKTLMLGKVEGSQQPGRPHEGELMIYYGVVRPRRRLILPFNDTVLFCKLSIAKWHGSIWVLLLNVHSLIWQLLICAGARRWVESDTQVYLSSYIDGQQHMTTASNAPVLHCASLRLSVYAYVCVIYWQWLSRSCQLFQSQHEALTTALKN